MCKARLQADASYAQPPQESSGWEMPEKHSIDNLIRILQLCRKTKNLAYAKRVHANICNNGLECHRTVGNYIVPMFVECGSLPDAQHIFNRLFYRNVHSWTSLILGFIECGQFKDAFNLYQKMQEDNVHPSSYTLVALLNACARIKDVKRGHKLHVDVAQKGFERDVFVGSALVDMYAKCGSISKAREVLYELPVRNVVSWSALIAGYAEHGPAQEALKCFEQMQLEGISPNGITFVCVLKACASMGAIEKGREIHADLEQKGFRSHIVIGSTLVDMYVKCGSLSEAQEVFEGLTVRDVVLWNALIAGYAEHGPGHQALKCFEQMQMEGVSPDAVTFVCLLKACGSTRAIVKGRDMHTEITKKGFRKDSFVGSALIDMYVKCGSLSEAQQTFDELPVRDVVSWGALIAGYAEHGLGQEALKCFEQMQVEGVSPNLVIYVCALKACGSIGAIEKGRKIHTDIVKKGFDGDVFVGNTLVDMYAKCGSLSEAQHVFDNLPVQDVVSWSAMIQGYGMNQEGDMAVQCFKDMQQHGVKPVDVTFTCLLSACSRTRLVLKGQEFFNLMTEEYCILPTQDHYTCMVDLLARSGQLSDAENFLRNMPRPSSWRALLSACKIYGKTELGQTCFQQLLQMNPEYASPYVLMANIYLSTGRSDDAYRVEELRKHAGANKKPGSAVIEVNKHLHEFMVGNNQSKEISTMLDILGSRIKEQGYVPNVNQVLRPIDDDEKETASCEHAGRDFWVSQHTTGAKVACDQTFKYAS